MTDRAGPHEATRRKIAGAQLGLALIRAHLADAFTALHGDAHRNPGRLVGDTRVADYLRTQIDACDPAGFAAVVLYLSGHAAAGLSVIAGTTDPQRLNGRLDDPGLGGVAPARGCDEVKTVAVVLVRAYLPLVEPTPGADIAAAARAAAVLSQLDYHGGQGTDVVVYLGELAARITAKMFGPNGYTKAVAALDGIAPRRVRGG